MLSRDGDGDETTPRSGPSPSGTDVGRSWADVSRGTPGDGSSGRSRRGGENDKLVDLRGRRIAKNSFYVWMDALVVVSGIQNTHTNATLGNVRIRLADNFQQREGRWEGDKEVLSSSLMGQTTVGERQTLLRSKGGRSDYTPSLPGESGKYERLYGAGRSGAPGGRSPGSGMSGAMESAGIDQALGRLNDSVTVGATQTNATLDSMNSAQQIGFTNLQVATTAGLANLQASQLTAGDVQDRVAAAMRGHQVAAADAPRVRGIYARFPRLREAVNDKILTNTVLLRMDDDQLERAERDLAVGKDENEQRLADAFSRTREEAAGRVNTGQTIRYNKSDSAHLGAPFVSSIPKNIRLYQRPTFSR